MPTKKKNISSLPCPPVTDVIGRQINKNDYVIYRPGGGSTIRIGKVVDVYMTENHSQNHQSWQIKVQLKALALHDITGNNKPRGATIDVAYCSFYNNKPGKWLHSQPPGPPRKWQDCTIVGDPALHAAAVKAIP